MKKLFVRNNEGKSKKGKAALSVLGGTTALAALAPAAGAAPIEFTGVSNPVSVGDAVATGVNFMNIFSDWTTLAYGVPIAFVIIAAGIWLVKKIPTKSSRKG